MDVRSAPGRRSSGGATFLLLATGLAVTACGGEPDRPVERPAAEVESLARPAPDEIRYELENVGYEIGDLRSLIESGVATVEPGADPEAMLAEARSAYEGALEAVAEADTARAADSLEAAARRIERVKRALGVAEEWGEPFEAESVPVGASEDVTS